MQKTPCDAFLAKYTSCIRRALQADPAMYADEMEDVLAEVALLRAEPPPFPHCVLSLTMKALDLTDKECLAFAWTVLNNIGESFVYGPFANPNIEPSETIVLRQVSGLSPSEFLTFISSERTHIIDGIIELSEGYNAMITNQSYLVSRVFTTALLEGPLTTDEYLKVSGTAISEVMEKHTGRKRGVESPSPEAALQEVVLQEPEDVAEVVEVEEEEENGDEDVNMLDAVLTRYTSDLDYLEDRFDVVAARLKLQALGMQDDQNRSRWDSNPRPESQRREYQATERAALTKCERRLHLTAKELEKTGEKLSDFIKAEQLREKCGLDDFEMWVIITVIAIQVSNEVRKIDTGLKASQGRIDVGQLLGMHCPNSLSEQMKLRSAFRKRSALVKNNLVRVSSTSGDSLAQGTLNDFVVEIDRRMLDFCAGLDTEISDLVDAASLITPEVEMDQVILPGPLKSTVIKAVETHDRSKAFREDIGFNAAIGNYGTGLVLMFHGPPGTGKTMFANALAKRLGRKILVINVPLFNSRGITLKLREAFRESSIQNALIFFDECDMVLADNSEWCATLLTELERFDGMMIMATNSVENISDALHRRITMTLEFPHPDSSLRQSIWKSHLPPKLKTKDIQWQQLSDYELSGGLIKNAVMCAITSAVARAAVDEDPVVSGQDLDQACRQQVVSRVRVKTDSATRITPKRGLSALVVEPDVMDTLSQIVEYERTRGFLCHQWGFTGKHSNEVGTTVLLSGAKGVGKSSAAEAIAYALSRTLLMFNISEVLGKIDSSGRGVFGFFKQSRDNNVVILLEGFECIDDGDVGVANFILSHARRAGGLVLASCTTERETPMYPNLDTAFHAHFKKPSQQLRERMWREFIPPKLPVASDFDPAKLSAKFHFTGAQIRSVIRHAAAYASSHCDTLNQEHFEKEAIAEETAKKKQFSHMYQ